MAIIKVNFKDILLSCFVNCKHKIRNQILFSITCVILSRLLLCAVFAITLPDEVHSLLDAINKMCHIWDNGWYRTILENGYNFIENTRSDGQATWAFFPMDIILIKVFSLNGTMSYEITGFAVNNIIFTVSMVVGFNYIMLTRNNINVAFGFVLFMSFGPYMFYFSCLYTEALFMLLILCTLYCMIKEKYILMGIFGAMLSATRNVGILIVFSVLFYTIQQHLKQENRSLKNYIIQTLSNHRLVLGVSLIPLGLFSYMLYLYSITGDTFAFMHVQTAWGRSTDFKLLSTIINSFTSEAFSDFNYLCIFIIIIIVLCSSFKLKVYEEVMYVFTVIIQMFSGFVGIARYSLGSGTFAIQLIDIIDRNFSSKAKLILSAFMLILSLKLMRAWALAFNYTIG